MCVLRTLSLHMSKYIYLPGSLNLTFLIVSKHLLFFKSKLKVSFFNLENPIKLKIKKDAYLNDASIY